MNNDSSSRPLSGGPLFLKVFFFLFFIWLWQSAFLQFATVEIPYSEFRRKLQSSEILECRITEEEISGKARLKDQEEPLLFRTVRIEDPNLLNLLEEKNVEFTAVRPSFLKEFLKDWVLPVSFLFILWSFLASRFNPGNTYMTFGRNRARLVADPHTGTGFHDLAGCDEAKIEMAEVVDFLKDPKRYQKLGARIPKGVLLTGPPGTGKTLLARAVAGEAGGPFFTLSGSDFVEMFVGVGAARVRDLFLQAKALAPCIVFIDEIDAIGRERGVRMVISNDEREQTLNQLLVEMDGFESNSGVIIMAATNRPEILDKALLRPGRFDRQVVLDPPDLEGRFQILQVHTRGKPLDSEVDLRKIAKMTPGFSGADLANTLNEAALLAARHSSEEITQNLLEEAVERVVAGPERKSRRLSEEERERVAYHEMGHALVALSCPGAEPVHKVSIIPRGRSALGYTLQVPAEEKFLATRSELFDRLKVLLAGRAAEEIVYEEISTGAENDLDRATELARQMVCLFGMSEEVGLGQVGHRPSHFLGPEIVQRADCSPETSAVVDREVKKILQEAYDYALNTLRENREKLERTSLRLMEDEILEGEELEKMLALNA